VVCAFDAKPTETKRGEVMRHIKSSSQYIHNAVSRLRWINMAARPDKRNGLFWELAADYQAFRPDAVDTVACPLCLTEYGLENIADLSREHVVPSKLRGRSETLTCRRKCNNTHGTRLDSHLINAMRAMDAVEGVAPIPTILGSEKGKIVAELFLPSGPDPEPFRIQIVGKASNMEASDDLRNNLRDGFTLNMQMSFPFIPERYFRAAFRAAFLSVFKAEGYQYALSVGAGQVRNMLEAEVPVLEKVIMEAFPEREPSTDLLVMPVTFNDVGECYSVLLRLRTKRTRYITVFLPGKSGSDWSALGALYEHAPRLRLQTIPHGWDSHLYIHFGYDPLFRVRKGMQDRFMPKFPPTSNP
jgi:hypothetical protein